VEYDLTIAPVNVEFADGTIQTFYLDKTWDVVAILKYITTSLDISAYGIGLYFDGQLLQFSKDLYTQGFSGDEPIQCYHYLFPSFTYNYELSLELEYARARMLLDQPGAYASKENYEIEELRGLARQIDYDYNAPLQTKQQAKQRFVEAAGRERVFRVLLGEEEKDLIFQQNHLKIRNVKGNVPGNMFYEWPLSDVRVLTCIPDFLQIVAVSNGREVKLVVRTPQTYLLRIIFYELLSVNSNVIEMQNQQRRGQLPYKPLSAHHPTFNCTHAQQPPQHSQQQGPQNSYNQNSGNFQHQNDNRNIPNSFSNLSINDGNNANRGDPQQHSNQNRFDNNNASSNYNNNYNATSGSNNNFNSNQINPNIHNSNTDRANGNYQNNNFSYGGGNNFNQQQPPQRQNYNNDNRANFNPQQQQYNQGSDQAHQQQQHECPACHSGNPPRLSNCYNCGNRL
jgi:hypothetical protein